MERNRFPELIIEIAVATAKLAEYVIKTVIGSKLRIPGLKQQAPQLAFLQVEGG